MHTRRYKCKEKSTSTSFMMNPDFKALLQGNGVDSPVFIRILELDGVTSERIFHRLKSQHNYGAATGAGRNAGRYSCTSS